MSAPRIAVTTGDPAGIGPELVLKAAAILAARVAAGEFTLVVLGSAATHAATVTALRVRDPFKPVPPGRLALDWPDLAFLDVAPDEPAVPLGEVHAAAGQVAYDAIEGAVRLAQAGEVAAICTGPINKAALNPAGHPQSGPTELLAELTGTTGSVMMLAHGGFRVSHVSTHVALADVPARLTPARLRRVVELTDQALRRLGIAQPRIAVAALNPHAGEGGLFGREDIDVSAPTIAALAGEGFAVEGPLPGDTVFVKLRAGRYDAVVAMYHDQGHVPVKLLGFSVDPATGAWNALSGVNVTLGLPIIRTSVDHGTAFDIAGQGVADATSMVEAIDYALKLAAAPAEADPSA